MPTTVDDRGRRGRDRRRLCNGLPAPTGWSTATALLLMAALAGCGHSAAPAASPVTPGTTATTVAGPVSNVAATATTTAPTTTSTTRPVTTTTSTTTAPPAAPATTRPAPVSDATMLAVQQQLSTLGYWLGTPDGVNGNATSQAVMALQKAAGLSRTGVFGPETAAALAAGTRPTPQSTSGHVIEIDLAHQLLLVVTNGHVDAILNTSTGGGYRFYDQGAAQIATTPVGHFNTTWEFNGMRVSSLGELWRPKFFVGGIAIHGSPSVPGRPVSHGCVRVSNAAIDWIWSAALDPIGTPVWVY